MRKLLAAMAIMVASLAVFEGCAPIPLPHYAAWKPKRVEELLVDSENLRHGRRRLGAILAPRSAFPPDTIPHPWRPWALIARS